LSFDAANRKVEHEKLAAMPREDVVRLYLKQMETDMEEEKNSRRDKFVRTLSEAEEEELRKEGLGGAYGEY
jgi:hypothetical protein